jgi:hypothetical protein
MILAEDIPTNKQLRAPSALSRGLTRLHKRLVVVVSRVRDNELDYLEATVVAVELPCLRRESYGGIADMHRNFFTRYVRLFCRFITTSGGLTDESFLECHLYIFTLPRHLWFLSYFWYVIL